MKIEKNKIDKLKLHRLTVDSNKAPSTQSQDDLYGDEAPRLKDMLIVLAIFLFLMALSWVGYHVFGWGQ